ncbi:MAG: hypothetical protein EOP93_06400 [Lysobacteraceae bacterium]|nr:MAG: hypothetical protein EOP93_06400 [Xanthomonadaceae bacterium]
MHAADSVAPQASPRVRAEGRAWLYVLAANGGEDLLKVGLTHDPLSRFSAFHPRWYEAFDLADSLLVACEQRGDAQALETALHRELAEHSCPMPLTIRAAAGGASEWYRGAYAHARRFVDQCEAQGHGVERDARSVLAPAMREQAHRLDGLLRQAHSELMAGWLGDAQRRGLVDLVDGHRFFDPELEARLPRDAWLALQYGVR